jgi:ABC-type branched-subunit amino acid transport system substrate-binding protein
LLERAATVLTLVTVLGCPSPARTEQLRPPTTGGSTYVAPEAQRVYDDALAAFQQSRWADAEGLYAEFLSRFPFSPLTPDVRYRRAVCLNRLGRYVEARQTLREFLERHPTSDDVPRAAEELKYAEAMVAKETNPPPVPELPPAPAPSSKPVATIPPPPLQGVTLVSGASSLDAIRRTIQDAKGGSVTATQSLEGLIEQASFNDIAALYAERDDSSPAWPFVATKMARVYFHLGDLDRAAEAAQKALSAGAAGHPERMQQILDRVALRDNVKPKVIGVVLPLSGRLKVYGEAIQDGIKLAIPANEGITVIYKDSQGEPEQAAAAVEAAVAEGAMVIIGPVGATEAGPAALRAQELGVPMISLSRVEKLTEVGPYIFRNSLTNSAQGRALARYAIEQLGSKANGILAPDVASGSEVYEAFWHGVEAGGGEIRAFETYPYGQTTFKGTIQRLVPRTGGADRAEIEKQVAGEKNEFRRKKLLQKLLGRGGKPAVDFDALLIPDDYKSVLQIAPSLAVEDVVTDGCSRKKLQGLRPVTLLGTAAWNSPDLLARGARYVQCSVIVDGFYVDSERNPTKRFVADFTEQYKRAPWLLNAQGFDTARIVRDVMLQVKPSSRDAFRSALTGVKGYPGATGDTTFGPDREADKPLFFLLIDKGAFSELTSVTISPAGLADSSRAALP